MVQIVDRAQAQAAHLYAAAKNDVCDKASKAKTAFLEAPVIRDVLRETNRVIEGVKNPPYNTVGAECERLEKMLNKVDLIPIASILSGWFRMGIGATELVTFLALRLFKDIAKSFISNPETLKKFEDQGAVETALAMNGFANIVRGFAVSSTSMNPMTILIHKLAILTYDQAVKCRYVYPDEDIANIRFPIGLSFAEPKPEVEKGESRSYLASWLPASWVKGESLKKEEIKFDELVNL